MLAYYTDITWKDIEPKAEEFQVDPYSAVRADPSTEETYRRTWRPLPCEPVQEPQPQGFGARSPWTSESSATAMSGEGPPSPPPKPRPRGPLASLDPSNVTARGRGRGRGTTINQSPQPVMPHPPGSRPGPQPPGYSKASPEPEVIAAMPAKPSTKVHPCRAYGEKDRRHVRMPRTMPYEKLPPTRQWVVRRTMDAKALREKLPDFHKDLLTRVCYEAEIACLILDN